MELCARPLLPGSPDRAATHTPSVKKGRATAALIKKCNHNPEDKGMCTPGPRCSSYPTGRPPTPRKRASEKPLKGPSPAMLTAGKTRRASLKLLWGGLSLGNRCSVQAAHRDVHRARFSSSFGVASSPKPEDAESNTSEATLGSMKCLGQLILC
jgi:hypothetical protein